MPIWADTGFEGLVSQYKMPVFGQPPSSSQPGYYVWDTTVPLRGSEGPKSTKGDSREPCADTRTLVSIFPGANVHPSSQYSRTQGAPRPVDTHSGIWASKSPHVASMGVCVRGQAAQTASSPLARQVKTKDESRSVGRISKQWGGLLREALTDEDDFGLQFPLDLDVKVKAVLLGATFLIVSWLSLPLRCPWKLFVLAGVLQGAVRVGGHVGGSGGSRSGLWWLSQAAGPISC